jgi:hypothetical protein
MLTSYQKEIKQTTLYNGKFYFSEEKQKEIVARYLKGVTIEDLSMQFDCSIQIIEQILFNKEIEIVNNKPPRQTKKFGYKRKS